MEALMIQHKMESEKLEAVRERLKMEAELESKKRAKEREEVIILPISTLHCYKLLYPHRQSFSVI